jgi:hypothetical protein
MKLYMFRIEEIKEGGLFFQGETCVAGLHLLENKKLTLVNFTFMWPCIVTNFFIIRPTRCTNFANFIFGMKLYMFQIVPLSIIRSLFTVHSAMAYVIQVCRQLSSRSICSCSKAKPVWHTPLLGVHWINSWWWKDEMSETCSFMTK